MVNESTQAGATPLNRGQDDEPRFAVKRFDSTGKVVSQQTTHDPDEAMRGFVAIARLDFGRDLGRGSYVALTDLQGSLDAAKTHEGLGVYNTRFATPEGRQLYEVYEPAIPGVHRPVDRLTRTPASRQIEAARAQEADPSTAIATPREAAPQIDQTEAARPPRSTAASTVNSLEFVTDREPLFDSLAVAQLRRQALERRAASEPKANPQASQQASPDERPQVLETIARMTEPELKAFVDASKLSRASADQVLRRVETRVATEADRPGAYRPIPPLEERFNVRQRPFARDYEFRDQAGKLAFTESLLSMQSTVDSPAVVKAMVERAQERGWTTVRVSGSAEFQRQAWIIATARGIKAVGYEPTDGDRLAASEERDRLGRARGQAEPQSGGTLTREATRERDVPAWADPNKEPVPTAPARSSPAAQSSEDVGRPQPEGPVAAALRGHLTEQGESAQDAHAIVDLASRKIQGNRVYVGTVKETGVDHFDFDQKNERSPYVKLQSAEREKIVWGVDLPRALDEGQVKVGDAIVLEHRGLQPVTVVVKERDAEGRIVGEHDEIAKRNTWFAVKVEQLRDEALGRRPITQEQLATKRKVEPDVGVDSSPVQGVAAKVRKQHPVGRDALVFEALEAAFEAKNVPVALRDQLRVNVRNELEQRRARGQTVGVKVYDAAAAPRKQKSFKAPQPQRQREELERGR